jgi:bacterioferritin-associated ferredoxin
MECLKAQGIISEAVDREATDATQLAEAKAHCKGCPTCTAFVRTLMLSQNAPLPQPPTDLVDRVMQAVRAEDEQVRAAAAALAASAALAEDGADAPAEAGDPGAQSIPRALPDAGSPKVSPLGAIRHWALRLTPQERLTWASAAVIFVATIGIGTATGVRLLTARPSLTTADTMSTAAKYGAVADGTTAAPEFGASASAPAAKATLPAGSYITVNGVVFVLSGPSTIATEGLRPAGTATTGLGTGTGPASHAVFSAADPDRIYIADANKQMLAFDRVARTYAGATYQLMSAELSDYGQWPTLPSSITAPTAEDGSPSFVPLAEDPPGTRIYRLATSGPEVGIAVAPGTGTSDPAAGNPNWTWWTKIP